MIDHTDHPADFQVDINNCDREPIHQLGRVQPFGALMALTPDWIIAHVSANIDSFVGCPAEELLGEPLESVLTKTALHALRSRIQLLSGKDAVERLFSVQLTESERLFDVAVHRSGAYTIVEIEQHIDETDQDYISYIRPLMDRIQQREDPVKACDLAARQLKGLLEFDRVMVYRFAPDGSGEVIAESAAPGVDSFMGLRYPSTDIPQQARELYKRNLLRIISDVGDEGVQILPPVKAGDEPLDLSLSVTRAVSPIHLEYLRNMGVEASLSISIMRRGQLWGLFACHHYSPKTLPFSVRTAAELYAQMFSYILEQKELDMVDKSDRAARQMHDRLMSILAGGTDMNEALESISDIIGDVIDHDGLVISVGDSFTSRGSAPDETEFRKIGKFLNRNVGSKVFTTDSLGKDIDGADEYASTASGMMAIPVSRRPRDYLALFRREVVQRVSWAGNPDKPFEVGPNGSRLTPRKSFETWKQLLEGHAEPWNEQEIRAAESLRITLLEVVLKLSDQALAERNKAQQQQDLLIAELNHRVKNILTLIRGLMTQSADAPDIGTFMEVVGGRIQSLARAHDQITQENWEAASVQEMIRTEASAYLGEKAARLDMSGPDANITPKGFTALSLVIHEMMTNSVKYGALSDSTGRLIVGLSKTRDDDLVITWEEQGGPPVQAPTRQGFGTTIIERSIPYDLKGEADVHFNVEGVTARFLVPARYIAEFKAARTQTAKTAKPKSDAGLSGSAMIVDDNMIIAMDGEDILGQLGADPVYVANSVEAALEIIEKHAPDFTLLDVNLESETSEPIAQALYDKGLKFAFATGYGDRLELAKKFPDAIVIPKPYDLNAVRSRLDEITK